MKDIPLFTTPYGVACLILKEIPYTQRAYIRLVATENPAALLRECIAFCRSCGAEKLYAAGHAFLEKYPLHATVVRMQRSKDTLGKTDAELLPVQEETLEQWRSIYNEKMHSVPNAAYMDTFDAKKMLTDGSGYFIYRNGSLLGIGKVSQDTVEALAGVVPGSGRDIALALCSLLTGDTISIEVARENKKAVYLYKTLGFSAIEELSRWYLIA